MWKVLQVVGHDHLGACPDGSRQNVTIIRIRKLESSHQRLVSVDKTVANRTDHELACSRQSTRLQVGSIQAQVLEDLVEDLVSPLRLDKPCLGDTDQEIPQRARIQHVRVIQNDEAAQVSPIS